MKWMQLVMVAEHWNTSVMVDVYLSTAIDNSDRTISCDDDGDDDDICN